MWRSRNNTDLVSYNLHYHFPEKISRATRPPMLLVAVGFKGTRQLIFNLSKNLKSNNETSTIQDSKET